MPAKKKGSVKHKARPKAAPLRPSAAAARVWAIPHLRQAIVSHFPHEERGRLLLDHDALSALIHKRYHRVVVNKVVNVYHSRQGKSYWAKPWTTLPLEGSLLDSDSRVAAVYRAEVRKVEDHRLSLLRHAPCPDDDLIRRYMTEFPRLETLSLQDGKLKLDVSRTNGATSVKGAITTVNPSPKAVTDDVADVLYRIRQVFGSCPVDLHVAVEMRLGDRSAFALPLATPPSSLVLPDHVTAHASFTLHVVEDAFYHNLDGLYDPMDRHYSVIHDYPCQVIDVCASSTIPVTKVGIVWLASAWHLTKLDKFVASFPPSIVELEIRSTTSMWWLIVCAFKRLKFPAISTLALDLITGDDDLLDEVPDDLVEPAQISCTVHHIRDPARPREPPFEMPARLWLLGGAECHYDIRQTGIYDDSGLDWSDEIEEQMTGFLQSEVDDDAILHLNGRRFRLDDEYGVKDVDSD